jgi:hypothetical protein
MLRNADPMASRRKNTNNSVSIPRIAVCNCPAYQLIQDLFRITGQRETEKESVMKAAVLVEKLGAKKYRASTSQPIPLETQGRTRVEAVKRLRALAQKRLSAGQWEQVSLPGPPQANPWIAYSGIWKDHPDIDSFLENIAEYRRAANAADAAP